jgi:transposase
MYICRKFSMSINISIPKADLAIITKKRKTEPKSKFQRRYQCLWMLNENYLKKDIAILLGVNIDTITDWIKIYNQSGLEGLGLLHYDGRRPSQLDSVKSSIEKIISTQNVSRIKDLQALLINEHKIKVEHSWLYRYCKKNSICLIKNPD